MEENLASRSTDRSKRFSYRMNISSFRIFSLICITLFVQVTNAASGTEVACPWYNDESVMDELRSGCVCAQNPPSSSLLSVQCHDIDGHQLVELLSDTMSKQGISIGLLYLNASFITDDKGRVPEKIFSNLKLVSLQLSNCMIHSIHVNAFHGLENSLKHLSLTQNQLSEVPSASVSHLANLLLLDLSLNKITRVEAGAFRSLHKLSTLKLNDNGLEMDPYAFMGLEKTLKNLNLKATRLSSVPVGITNLSSLAFLDMAQNRLRELEKFQFANLHSLTALNLERNLLQSLPNSAFYGVNDTLSSLSLLNNLITYYPTLALRSLRELRVLDLGFNLLTEIPKDAFSGLNSLTLLAVDGNPLSTLPKESFLPINSTLRGISIGGRFLACDCRMQWLLDWKKEFDLQITSRERNPQFCGSPQNLRSLNFQQIKKEDLVCIKNETVSVTSTKDEIPLPKEVTVLSIDTPMAELKFENGSGEEETHGEIVVKEYTTTTEIPEKPIAPITEYRNPNHGPNGTRFRFRRPRPRPRTSTAKPVFISSTERFTENSERILKAAEKNDADDSHSAETNIENNNNGSGSVEDDSREIGSDSTITIEHTLHRPSTKFVKPLPPHPQENTDVDDFSRPTSLPFSSTTRRYNPNSLKTLRSFHQSAREGPARLSTSTATSVSVSSSSSMMSSTISSSRGGIGSADHEENMKVPLIRAKPSTMSITPKPVIVNSRPSPTVVRKASIDTKDFDDSKIPIISGVGPTRHTSEGPNIVEHSRTNGNILPIIKSAPSSVQTQSVLMVQPPPSHNHNPSSYSQPSNPRNPSLIFAEKSDIVLRDIQRNTDSIMLRWESMKPLNGYRIIYRMFGEDSFRHGPPLAPTEREYRIKHIPFNECVVVCVVPLDDILYNEINPNAGSVPPGSQCRELKPTAPSILMNHMDKITIGASAAICATVIIAVLLFIAITRRSKGKRSPSASTLVSKVPPSLMTPSPGPQGIPQSMNLIKDWDQLSAVSARSIPRPRVYHGSLDHLANGTAHRQSMIIAPSHRSIPDGHSTHRSYLSQHHHHHNHSMHSYGHHHGGHGHAGGHGGHGHGHHVQSNHGNGFIHTSGRPVRQSMMSIRSTNDILASKQGFNHGPHTHSHRHFEQNHKRKRAGRPSQSESLNTLSGYDTPDNWTDHDMDVYVARNHARHDLVQL